MKHLAVHQDIWLDQKIVYITYTIQKNIWWSRCWT